MSARVTAHDVEVAARADGTPWRLRFVEIEAGPGPATAFVAGVFGDKPLGTVALWQLARRLSEERGLCGTVTLCPAANPPALEAGTRVSPDHLYLNRSFPGAASGFLTNQIAHTLLRELLDRTDHVVDLHSGSPAMALWYTYDYGDVELSASFGYTPVITGFAQPGQLSAAVVAAGGKSMLVEFGGGALGDAAIGVEGCLNVLRYRGQLGGRVTGPSRVPLVEADVALFLPSHVGILVSAHDTAKVGQIVPAGRVAHVDSPGSGKRLEEFAVDRDGLLLLANVSPTMIAPGAFGAAVGFPSAEIDVPGAAGGRP